MKIALILDRDLGLMFWLAEILGGTGYSAYPALTVADAEHLLGKLGGEIDLAIVNPALPQTAGLLRSLSERTSPPSIVTLGPDSRESLAGLLELVNKQPCHAA